MYKVIVQLWQMQLYLSLRSPWNTRPGCDYFLERLWLRPVHCNESLNSRPPAISGDKYLSTHHFPACGGSHFDSQYPLNTLTSSLVFLKSETTQPAIYGLFVWIFFPSLDQLAPPTSLAGTVGWWSTPGRPMSVPAPEPTGWPSALAPSRNTPSCYEWTVRPAWETTCSCR